MNKRTLQRLQAYPWPGNVRELHNIVERSMIISGGDDFTVDESWLATGLVLDSHLTLPAAVLAHEKGIIEEALRARKGRVFGPSGAAAGLGIPRSTLESRIRALKIQKARLRARPRTS